MPSNYVSHEDFVREVKVSYSVTVPQTLSHECDMELANEWSLVCIDVQIPCEKGKNDSQCHCPLEN